MDRLMTLINSIPFCAEVSELSAYNEDSSQVVELHLGKFVSKFTHGDLHPRNVIIVKHGKILSIIDLDCAGWRPGYSDPCDGGRL